MRSIAPITEIELKLILSAIVVDVATRADRGLHIVTCYNRRDTGRTEINDQCRYCHSDR